MNWFDRTVAWLFPRILLSGTPWQQSWEQREREAFVSTIKTVFPVIAVVYIAHYYLFDLPMNLEPIKSWFWFRFGTATLFMVTMLIYCTKYAKGRHYKLVAAVTLAFLCFAQGRVAVNFGQESWVFCFVVVAFAVQVLKEPLVPSLVIASVLLLLISPSLVETGVPFETLLSSALVTYVILIALRTTYRKDLDNFILNQEFLAKQEQLAELNHDFTDRIRSFIPTVISNRIDSCVNENRMSVIEASIEVLKAEEKNISCLFSDIRGFTQHSKDLESYITKSVIPEMRVCSTIIEKNHGIPRKIGDLVFAYFDSDISQVNTTRTLLSAIEISNANQAMNRTLNQKQVDRYILVSTGEAIVGNIGGVDSSVEITALGPPVNFLSRLDELTKSRKLQSHIEFGDVVVCSETFKTVAGLGLKHHRVDLARLGLIVKDFPESTVVYVIKPTDQNGIILREEIDRVNGANLDDRQRLQKIA